MSDNGKFPIDEAQIVGLFMECVCYGIYLCTFGLCLRALLLDRERGFAFKHRHEVHWGMLAIAFLMLIFSTFDVAFGLRHNLDAFIFYRGPGGAAEEFHDISYWVNIMKTVDYVAQTTIGDAVLNYRCWVIYNNSWLTIAFPTLLWMATLACGCLMIWVEATTTQGALLNESRIRPFLYSIVALTLVLNILVTGLIVWRIWRVRRRTVDSAVHPNRLRHVIRIVIDSGLMYTITVIVFFGTTLAESNAQYGVSDVVVQTIGIAFNLILIRVSEGTASDGALYFASSSGLPHSGSVSGSVSASFPMHFLHPAQRAPTYTLRTEVGMEVEVRRVTERDGRVLKTEGPWKGAGGAWAPADGHDADMDADGDLDLEMDADAETEADVGVDADGARYGHGHGHGHGRGSGPRADGASSSDV